MKFRDFLVLGSTRLRKKRFIMFLQLIKSLKRPLRILDVGGVQDFWDAVGFQEPGITVCLLNIYKIDVNRPGFSYVIGDARGLDTLFKDKEFDVVFSNSFLEHIALQEDQRRIAGEIRRIGKSYFIQVPNRNFPIEPHFCFPFFQFFPEVIKAWFVNHFPMGFAATISDKEKALEFVKGIRLFTENELEELFPDGIIFKEKFLGLTKSFIVSNLGVQAKNRKE